MTPPERAPISRSTQIERARAFRALHDRRRPLLLPNAWDAGSAAALASAGFPAIATTSGGVAWSLGYPDGERAPLSEVLAAVGRITRAVSVPVTVDLEAGYAADPAGVRTNVRLAIDAGAVGLNLEDGVRHLALRPIEEAAARIAAAREAAVEAGVPVFVNARVDTWAVPSGGDDAERLDETVRRARAYLDAGADGVFPIGARRPALLRELCARVDAPVNVAALDGLPSLAELAELGVARVSTATRLATLAYGAARDAAARLLAGEDFTILTSRLAYADLQRLFPVTDPDPSTGP